mgnify:CR=1 FL=1
MKIDKTLNKAVAGSALALLAVSGVAVADNHEATTTYKFGGYAKADVLFTSYSDATPDGICLDREGALWVASPGSGEVIRVKQGGAILARCTTRGTPYACMLGGPGRCTLYVCSAETDDPDQAARRKSGRIEQVEVAVPGAGRP